MANKLQIIIKNIIPFCVVLIVSLTTSNLFFLSLQFEHPMNKYTDIFGFYEYYLYIFEKFTTDE